MNKERIATLLASGLSVSSVATIVGVSPARISQLQQEEGFATIYAGKLAEIQKKDAEEVNISAKYLEAEHVLIKQIIEAAPVSELPAVTAALRVVAERQDRAKQRANPVMQQTPVYNTIVQLNMPTHAIPEISFSQTNEVIAIEDRTLTPMSSKAVTSLFASMDAENERKEHDAISSIESTENRSLPSIPTSEQEQSNNQRNSTDSSKKESELARFVSSIFKSPESFRSMKAGA